MEISNITVTEMSRPGERDQNLPQLVQRAFHRALSGTTKLSPEVLTMPGMSGQKYRRFINSLIEELPEPRYLEIGSWMGSTLCSAAYGNNLTAVAIDNWSQFDGPSGDFLRNVARFKGTSQVNFLERDFKTIDFAKLSDVLGPFDVYLYDGPHLYQDQYEGIARVQPALRRSYVQVVDDWNWPDVRNATFKAIEDLELRIRLMVEIRTSLNDEHAPPPHGEASDWHNGYFIGVLDRTRLE